MRVFITTIIVFFFITSANAQIEQLFLSGVSKGTKGKAFPELPSNTLTVNLGLGYPNLIASTLDPINNIDSELGTAIDVLNTIAPFVDDDKLNQVVADVNNYAYTLETIGKAKKSPQFTLALDYAITDNISFGPYFGYATAKTEELDYDIPDFDLYETLENAGIDINAIGIIGGLLGNVVNVNIVGGAGRGAFKAKVRTYGIKTYWHTNMVEKLDVYALGGFGINSVKTTSLGDDLENAPVEIDLNVPDFSYSGHIGLRYFFTDNFGAYAEVGYGVGVNAVNVGASYRFGKGLDKLREHKANLNIDPDYRLKLDEEQAN